MQATMCAPSPVSRCQIVVRTLDDDWIDPATYRQCGLLAVGFVQDPTHGRTAVCQRHMPPNKAPAPAPIQNPVQPDPSAGSPKQNP
jgi:hypothetical protein